MPWGNWPGLAKILAGAPVCELGQAWLAAPSPGFRPSRVWTGWTSEALIIYAELEDADVFNPVTAFNALAFRSGDVFEMFLRQENQAAYYEFHITPGNQKLQLRIPSATAFEEARRQPCIPTEWFVTSRVVESQVRVDAAAERWSVVAAVPFDLVAEKGRPQTRIAGASRSAGWTTHAVRTSLCCHRPRPTRSAIFTGKRNGGYCS